MRAFMLAIAVWLGACGNTKMRTINHAVLAAASTALACDYGQTVWAAQTDWVDRYEANPILGRAPSTGRITAYFAAIGLIAFASTELPEWLRTPLYAGTLVVEAHTVIRNSTLWEAPWCGLHR